jgi:hypothetical protein
LLHQALAQLETARNVLLVVPTNAKNALLATELEQVDTIAFELREKYDLVAYFY